MEDTEVVWACNACSMEVCDAKVVKEKKLEDFVNGVEIKQNYHGYVPLHGNFFFLKYTKVLTKVLFPMLTF